MSVTFLDDLPGLGDDVRLSLRTRGASAFLRSPRFIARICLQTAKVEWLVERSPVKISREISELPRRIDVSGSDLWISESGHFVAEIMSTENGALAVSAREVETGKELWQHLIPTPDPADWAEPSPAWPGAQTEEIDAFLADDSNRLIVCLFRQSRTAMQFSSTHQVDTLPRYWCQTDAVRFEPPTGKAVWRGNFQDLFVGIIERDSFTGIWSHGRRLGMLDLEGGRNSILYESPNVLGWPVRDGSLLSVPWHSKGQVGVDWIDDRGCQVRKGAWQLPRVHCTQLHPTESGLALHTNHQSLWWLGREDLPLWNIRAKPYIYHVYSSPGTDVFVGTDGNGGRLLGLDASSGRERLNVKPPFGGAGQLIKVLGHPVLVAKFWSSPRDPTAGRLFILSMKDRNHVLANDCRQLVGPWQHGAVCLVGQNGERLAIVDIRSTDS
jgi:hypothetical protein